MDKIGDRVIKEIKRFGKYAAIGSGLGAGIAGSGGYVILDAIHKEVDKLAEYVLSYLPSIAQTIFRFFFGRYSSRVKSSGIMFCIFQGAGIGFFLGGFLGITRIGLGVVYRSLIKSNEEKEEKKERDEK